MPIHTQLWTLLPFFFVLLVLIPSKLYRAALRLFIRSSGLEDGLDSSREQVLTKLPGKENASNSTMLARGQDRDQFGELQLYKDLYYKLQNLEQFPNILPQSRDVLISLFSETLANALSRPEPGILSLEQYIPSGLAECLRIENNKITRQWEEYIARRRAGGPTELFQDKNEAIWWLRQIAPVKYVDGAWLGHINKVTTPFTLRPVTKDAWQVLSEELGDGDPRKNHVYVYRELMDQIESGLPEAYSVDFIHPRHNLNEISVWKAAVAQLLISLFPHEFLPEILGFNMHFEGLTMETMKAAKEVEEIGLDPYYFVLHISIDNADSGHTAIAMQAVVKYLEHVRRTEGAVSEQKAWRRVQAGFVLSAGLSAGPESPSQRQPAVNSFPRNTHEAEVIRIFKAKAPVAHKIHCGSRMRIGGRMLVDWLEPNAFAGKQWQMDFLEGLSNMRPWIRRGDSSGSKLVQELSWPGKMFGSFTQSEVEVVKRWIDGLGKPNPQVYWSFVALTATPSDQVVQNKDVRVDYPVLSQTSAAANAPAELTPPPSPSTPLLHLHPAIKPPSQPKLFKLLPLWFTIPSLLEQFVSIPSRTTTVTASSIVRLLRAQSGFDAEGPGVAGMDEARRTDSAGLIELGLEMIKRSQACRLGREPGSLKEVLDTWPSGFALKMLQWSMAPMANVGLLLGLAWTFIDLHEVVVDSSSLLSEAGQVVLRQIVQRERNCLEVCFGELRKGDEDGRSCQEFQRGCRLAREEIQACFGQRIGGGCDGDATPDGQLAGCLDLGPDGYLLVS